MTMVLVVDDEKQIRSNLREFLEKQGYIVKEAATGQEALDKFAFLQPDIILLDIMLPKMSGFDVLKQLRKISHVPIIMLTAKNEEVDKLIGLEIGADDYITKPFSLREVEARIKAILRRNNLKNAPPEKETIHFANLVIHVEKRQVFINEKPIDLTPSEFAILLTLARNPERPFSRLQLLNAALGENYAGYERSIDTHVSNLRKKIEEISPETDFIQTVYGIGYKFGVEK